MYQGFGLLQSCGMQAEMYFDNIGLKMDIKQYLTLGGVNRTYRHKQKEMCTSV